MADAQNTPRGLRSVITFIGRRNAGKSSLINAVCGQDVAIVSDVAGTTTDAVAKPYELLPLGPVTFYDTAGLDDEGGLGQKRILATRSVMRRSDVAVLVCGEDGIGETEKNILSEAEKFRLPVVVAFNKTDICKIKSEDEAFCKERGLKYIGVSAAEGKDIDALKTLIIDVVPAELKDEPLLAGDLIKPGNVVVLVVPIDISAPKGRLILPQVQMLREILDSNAKAVVTKESDLQQALCDLKKNPDLVITDSQAILPVSKIVPQEVPLTTFSILFARFKGKLPDMVSGARKIDELKDGDRILIAEACSHHVQCDDIGRVKLPRLLQKYTGKNLAFDIFNGHDFPENLEDYALVVHCGACMFNRAELLNRLHECRRRNVSVTNYGVAISKTQGVLDRVVCAFGL